MKSFSIWTMAIVLILIFDLCIAEQSTDKPSDCVILLHGLARTENSLSTLEKHLKKEGFCVVNLPYPSREKKIETLSVETIPTGIERCSQFNSHKIHFVTHSMGGILVRYYLENYTLPNLGRVVMISPPNNGSEVVDKLKNLKLFRWLNGPAGDQLGTGDDSILNRLGLPYYETGIITGDKTLNPFLSLIIPGKDDGKVSIESAKLEGMKDFLVVHKSHTLIMNDKKVCQQVTSFIRNGKFDKNSENKIPN